MSEFRDPFPELPQVVDVGGDRYFMGPQKPIELGFKSRKDFLNSFGTESRTEYLIRKYLFLNLQGQRKFEFDSKKEKDELVKVLKKRAKQLEASKEFTSSVLKNTLIQRSYINILRLLQQLEGPDYKDLDTSKVPGAVDTSVQCESTKKYIRQIPEDKLFQLILEIAWYLLHPEDVPKKVECDWANTIRQLDTLRLGDIVAQIQSEQEKQGLPTDEKPFNYFKRINMEKVIKAKSHETALDQAKQMALQMQGETAQRKMKERLKTLLNILEVKKYLNNDLPVNEDRLKIIDVPAAEKISQSLISNPMRGGAAKALDKPVGIAMSPLFNYFKGVFDPVYSILEEAITNYSKASNKGENKGNQVNQANPNNKGNKDSEKENDNVKQVIIPQLTTLLHICNNLNPSDSTEAGKNTYGIYRIKNVDPVIVSFINTMLSSTHKYMDIKFEDDDTKKNNFNKQLYHLPKVRLSSLLNRFVNSEAFKDPESIPYTQFFSLGGNFSLLDKETFMNPKNPEMTEQLFNEVGKFFTSKDLYIISTKSENISENIPMNVYEIDFDMIDIGDTGIKIDNIPDNYFNKYKEPTVYFEKLVKTTPYVVYNDAELALSIFILFKELMPTK